MGGKALKRLTTLILYTLFSATLIADPIPEGARFENMEVVGYIDAALKRHINQA